MPKTSDKLKNVANALLEVASEMEDCENQIDYLAVQIEYLRNELNREKERRKRVTKLLTEEVDF